MTRPHLGYVAASYREAARQGLPPTKAIAEKFEANYLTARRWVSDARAKGFLESVTAGARVERNAKCLRVAEALGVEYDDLFDAIHEHAGGNIRLS